METDSFKERLDPSEDYEAWSGKRRDDLQEVSDTLGVQFHRGGISWPLPETEDSQFKGLRTGVNSSDVRAYITRTDLTGDVLHNVGFDTHSESGHLHGVTIIKRESKPGLRVRIQTVKKDPRTPIGANPDDGWHTTDKQIAHISELGKVLGDHDKSIPPPSPAVRAYNEAYQMRDLSHEARQERATKLNTEVDPASIPRVTNFDTLLNSDGGRVDPQTGRVSPISPSTTGRYQSDRRVPTTHYSPYDFATEEEKDLEEVDIGALKARLDEIHNEILGRSAQFHAASTNSHFKRMMKAENGLEEQNNDPRNPWGRI